MAKVNNSPAGSWVARCRWIETGDQAWELAPSLMRQLPPLADALRCLPGMTGIYETVQDVVATVVEDKPEARVLDWNERQVHQDPLCRKLIESVQPMLATGSRDAAVPSLVVLGATAMAIQGGVLGAKMRGLSPEGRRNIGQRLGREMAGRVSGAWGVVSNGTTVLDDGGVVQAMTRCPLLWGFPRGTLDRTLDWGEVAYWLEAPVTPGLVEAISAAVDVALEGWNERRRRGKQTGVDEAMAALLAFADTPASVEGLLVHPRIGPVVLGALPVWIADKEWKKRGLDRSLRKSMSNRSAWPALVASWSQMVHGLVWWDLLTVVSGLVCGQQTLAGDVNAGPTGPKKRAVLAVDMSSIADRLNTEGDQNTLGSGDAIVGRLWRSLAGDAISTMDSGCMGIAVLDDMAEALRFADRIKRGLSGPRWAKLDVSGTRVQIPAGCYPVVALDWGNVESGMVGNRWWLAGAPVQGAVHLLHQSFRVKLGGVAREGGVCVTQSFLDTLLQLHRDNGLTVIAGKGEGLGGAAVLQSWDNPEGGVGVAVDASWGGDSIGAWLTQLHYRDFAVLERQETPEKASLGGFDPFLANAKEPESEPTEAEQPPREVVAAPMWQGGEE